MCKERTVRRFQCKLFAAANLHIAFGVDITGDNVHIHPETAVNGLNAPTQEKVRSVQAWFFRVVLNIKPLWDWMSRVGIA